MTDDLEQLKAALKMATPAPDANARDNALAVAQKNFAILQEETSPVRANNAQNTGQEGFVAAAKDIFANFSLRVGLYATSGVVVIGIGITLVLPAPTKSFLLDYLQSNADNAKFGDVSETALNNVGTSATVMFGAQPTQIAAVSGNTEQLGRLTQSAQGLFEPTERFANRTPNTLKIVSENPISTFSIDVDTASYSFVRSSIMSGQLPHRDAVRVEEMINYFSYDYTDADDDNGPFATSVAVLKTPWNKHTKLVRVGIQGETVPREERPDLDLVFLIDTSGSMNTPNKLPLLKKSLLLLLGQLKPTDRVSIVTYAGSSGVALEPTFASDRATILARLEALHSGGGTAGHEGLQTAYRQAEKMHAPGRVGRVILATDGDFNVGISDDEELKRYVEAKKNNGVYLSVLGFGQGHFNDGLMQALAQNGNGIAAHIDTLSEAMKVMVDQVSGTLVPIANDVKIQVEFNPTKVAEYRLIGYETRALVREDFNNDKVDAGDIGAGHTVTALYEITPVGSPAQKSDKLRYQSNTDVSNLAELGFLKLRYKLPGESVSQLIEIPIISGGSENVADANFSAAIAGFGQLLRGDTKYLSSWSYSDVITLAQSAIGDDRFGYRAEAIMLMERAQRMQHAQLEDVRQ